jgi:Flp pilus assembly protein TadD
MTMRESDDYEREGRQWLLKGDANTALKVFQEGLARFPGDEALLLGLAMAHIDMGDLVRACEVLVPLRAKHPTWGDVRQGLAEAYLKRGQTKKALECIQEAIGEHEKDAAFVNALAVLLFKHRLHREALAIHDKALRLDPKFAPAHMGRGACLHQLEDVDGAISAVRKAVECAPDYYEAMSYLGNLLYDQRKKTEAKEILLRIPIAKLADVTTVKRLLALSKGEGEAERRKALRARLKQVDWLREALKDEVKAPKIVEKLENRMDQASLARRPKPKRNFWRGLGTILAGVVQEQGDQLNSLLAKIFAEPVRFADGQQPRLVRFDKRLGEQYLTLLARLLDDYPWRMDLDNNWRQPIQLVSVADSEETSYRRAKEKRIYSECFGFVDFANLALYGKAIVIEMRRRLVPKVLPQVAIVRLREAMERLKPYVPLKSVYYEAWLELRATLEPQ